MVKTKIGAKQVGTKIGGNFPTMEDQLNKVNVARAPFNVTQTLTGLTASTGDVIADALIPVNADIPDNRKISDSSKDTAANAGGICSAEGTETTGFITPGTFVHDIVVVTDKLGNVSNLVPIRYVGSHDEVTDTDGKLVKGLIVRPYDLADDTAMGEAASENLEICFVVDDGGTFKLPAGGVTGDIEFSVNRAIAERFMPEIMVLGGNAVNFDPVVDLKTTHKSVYTISVATTAVGGNLTLADGTLNLSGESVVTGDATKVTMPLEADFNDNNCLILIDGVEQNKGSGLDVEFVSAGVIQFNCILDIGDVITVYRKYA